MNGIPPLFSSPCLGILFSQVTSLSRLVNMTGFRPHVWGFFFHRLARRSINTGCSVFVPMFGDSFFTTTLRHVISMVSTRFRPHVWGFFFHTMREATNGIYPKFFVFSSPCLGILFSRGKKENNYVRFEFCFRPHVWGFFFHTTVIVMMIGK